jgi:hypothetical protein
LTSTPPLLVFTIVAIWRNFYWLCNNLDIRISTPPLFCAIIQCLSVSLVVQWFRTIWSNFYLSLYLYLTLDFDLYHSKHFLLNI